MNNQLILASLLLLNVVLCWGGNDSKDRVLLSSINTLTFYNSRYTTGRRSRPIAQMKCLGGSAGCRYMPSSMQCYNRGTDGRDVQWECKAELDKGVSLGETTVSCEGYNYPEDPYVLAGSCGVEFYLNKNGDFYKTNHKPHYSYSASHPFHWYNPFHWITSIFDSIGTIILFFVVCVFIIGLVGLNTIMKIFWTFMKIVLFPLYLMSCCCCHGCSGPQYAYYVPPPPPVYNNPWGNGFMWYEQGRHRGHQEAAFFSENNYYHDSDHHSDDSTHTSTHTSTSYASTSRR